jgi:PPOX class probable F420-dependent enzyme
MSLRDRIRMDDVEVLAFLEEERTVTCATLGRDGFPHLMPLWYVVRDGRVWAWTFAKSQKTRNLERDPRATLQVEAGTEYAELRGVMLRTEVTVHRDLDTVAALGTELGSRYELQRDDPEASRRAVMSQAPKRVALEFAEVGRVSWDHRKLPPMRASV